MMEKQQTISIMIIDDDKMLAMALKGDLENTFGKEQVSVSTFESGEHCLEHLTHKPDVAIVDYHLDGKHKQAMNGVQIIDLIKTESPHTEVIMFTSEEHADIAVKAMHHGAHDYIVKNDYMFRKLNISVTQCVKLKRLKAELKTQQIRSNILAFSLAAMAGALIALELWAPQVLNR